MHKMNSVPICSFCQNNELPWRISKNAYKEVCESCFKENNMNYEKLKKTKIEKYGMDPMELVKHRMKEKYGVDNIFATEEFKESRKEATLQQYGVEYFVQTEEFRDKNKNTVLEKYGVEHYSKTKEFKEKFKNTSLEKYGVEHVNKNPEISSKIKKTHIDKYGNIYFASEEGKKVVKHTNMERYEVEYPLQNPDIYKKMVSTNIQKYGVEHVMRAESIKMIARRNNLQKYGVENYKQIRFSPQTLARLRDKNWLYDMHVNKKMPMHEISKMLDNISRSSIINRLILYKIPVLRFNQSYAQKEICEFLINNGYDCVTNEKTIIKPYELDIYIPDKNLAIEYCGIYWHSDKFKNKDYHKIKYEMCKNKNVKLITIFEDEWFNSESFIKNKILNILSNTPKLHANINFKLDKNNLTIYDTEKMIASMQYNIMHDVCFLDNYVSDYSISNIFDKVLKFIYTEFNVNQIELLVDCRWPDEFECNTCMKYVEHIEPVAYGVKNIKRFILNDSNYNGLKIYDCGRLKFIKKQ